MKPRQVKPPRGVYGNYNRVQSRRPVRRSATRSLWMKLAAIPRRYAVALFVLIVVGIGFTQVFAVKRVNVVASDRRGEISEVAQAMISQGGRQANIVTLDPAGFARELMSREPSIKAAVISRNWPGGITVTATLKQPSLAWVTGNQKYVVDRDGTVIGNMEPGMKLPLIHDQKNLPVALGQRVVTARFIEFVTAVTKGMPALGLSPAKIGVKDTTLDLYVTTTKGYYVLLDTSRPAADELADLATIKRTLDAQKRTPVEYIDLRIQGKAYYK